MNACRSLVVWIGWSATFGACSTQAPPIPAPVARAADSVEWPKEHIDAPEQVFPPLERVAALAALPEPAMTEGAEGTSDFSIPGPFPNQWRDATPQLDGTTRFLVGQLPAKGHRATAAGQCVARSLARLVAARGGLPDADAKSYVLGKCKAPWKSVSAKWLVADGASKMSKSTWQKEFAPRLATMIASIAKGPDAIDYGITLARLKSKQVVLLAFGRRAVDIDRVVRAEDGARFSITGKLRRPSGKLIALINQGAYGVAHCVQDAKIKLPAFSLTCPADPSDDETWIELGALNERRTAGSSVVRLLVSPSGAKRVRYRVPRLGLRATAELHADPAQVVYKAIQRVRARADLEPLVFDVAQSQTVQALTPQYFSTGGDQGRNATRSELTLAVQAGWQVDGNVRFSTTAAAMVSNTNDLGFLIGSLLSRPVNRRTLTDPEARRIAIGVLWRPELRRVGALISTYATFDDVNLARLQDDVLQQLRRVRQQRGREPLRTWAKHPRQRGRLARALAANDVTDVDARQWLIDLYFTAGSPGGEVLLLRSHRLEDISWPESLVAARRPVVDIVAAYRKPAGHAWARYVVLVLRRAPALDSTDFGPSRPPPTLQPSPTTL